MDSGHTDRLQHFLREILRFGGVKGFKYFVCYLRSKEELVISVQNSSSMTESNSYPELEVLKQTYEDKMQKLHQVQKVPDTNEPLSSSDDIRTLPYDRRCLMLSLRTQRQLSDVCREEETLTPASPSETETRSADENSTLFLLAGYSKYAAPYVWLRSNHERLVKLSNENHYDRDWPLNLRTIKSWRNQDIRVWQVVAEIVKLCTIPSPLNPFEIDLHHFKSLPPESACYATAAMIDILSSIIHKSPEKTIHASKVIEDLQALGKLHYEAISSLVCSGTVVS